MKTSDTIKIKDFKNYSIEQLSGISINNEMTSEALIEGVGAIGTLLFDSSCSDNDPLSKDVLCKIGLLIQESIIIAKALDDNVYYSSEEIKRRSAPNQNSKLSENKLHGAIGDINNVELSLHQLKSDIYENEPDTPTLYAQLDLMANTLSKTLNSLDALIKEN
ncbi:hypothetical protein [Providencia rettgeri]|uniref:hypothetical protein n=1 Tax=Providencia rettgeri TaxID=587 RepID=UPI000CFFF0C7|nr:hypothetical protein [Providencia rettgeri]AVL74673.1 hypothetical protein CEQ08_13495 [Providencia rettgeri]